MGLPELKAVSTAARLGSLSRAAEVLNITQPALSRRIAEAEKSVGIILFERLSRGVKPTDACRAFLRHAEIALTSIEDGISAALQSESEISGAMSVGVIEVLCDDRMFAACHTVLSRFTGSTMDFRVSSWSADVSDDLMAGRTKIGLRYRKDPSSQLESLWIADDPVVVACSSSHPLAGRQMLTIEELEQAQWVGGPVSIDRSNAGYEDGVRFLGFQGWRTMDVNTIYARIRLIEAGLGIALIRRACIARQLAGGELVELSTPLAMSLPIFLAWRRGAYLGPVAEMLVSELRANFAEAGDT